MFSRTAIIVFFTFVAFFVASATALVVPRSASNSGEGTYFTTGLGACGKTNKESDRIVAVSAAFFDEFPGATNNPNKNPVCGRTVSIHYKGKSTTATVEDRCAGCPGYGDLDMTTTVFKELAPESIGRLYGVTWSFE